MMRSAAKRLLSVTARCQRGALRATTITASNTARATQAVRGMHTIKLQDNSLFRQLNLINGKWVPANNQQVIAVDNPTTGEIIGRVPHCGADETRNAIQAAYAAFPKWSRTTAAERSQILRNLHGLLLANKEDLATIITTECGKPLKEALGENAYSASYVDWFAGEAPRVYGASIPSPNPASRMLTIKQPIGVVAAITPWNFPSSMLVRKCAAALAAGCTVVLKPSEFTPYSAFAFCDLAARAGVPPGVLNCVTGSPEKIGGELTSNPLVRKVTFTGSTRVGKLLMKQCSETLKRLSLELGGNAPFIIFDDANLNHAIEGIVACKFRNAGQTCVSANRIFVQTGIYDKVVKLLTERVGKIKVGDGFEPGVELGPLINQAAIRKVEAHIHDAVQKGAQITRGGKLHALGRLFFEPTVLINAEPQMTIANEETFGPIAALFRFNTEEDVIKMANDTRAGLAAYFYSENIGRVWRVAEALECGMVGVNEPIISSAVAPFGGVKESGMGREGSKYGIDDYIQIKYICMGNIQ